MKTILILSAAGLLLVPAAALAAPPTMRVSYTKTELTTADGARAVLERIQAGAEAVCAPLRSDGQGLQAFRRFQACRRGTVEQAVASMNAPLVTAALRPQPMAKPFLEARR